VAFYLRKPKVIPRRGEESSRSIDLPLPTWRLVVALAWPVLAQQLLILTVSLSDSFLAGFFQPLPIADQLDALGHQVLAMTAVGVSGAGGSLSEGLRTVISGQVCQQIMARHVSYQAAQTTAHYLAWFVTSYTVLVSVGGTALVARFVGAGDRTSAIHATNQSILLAVILGLLGTIAGLGGMEWLAGILQLRGEAAQLAVEYLRPMFWLLVFQVVSSAGIACLVGAGDTRTGFMVLGGVTVLNLPLAWVFFLGIGSWRGFGFAGISLGTAVSQMVGGLVIIALLIRGRAGLVLKGRLLWPNRNLLTRLLRVSVPAGIDSLSVVVGQFWFLSIVNQLGPVASSAHGIALRWEAMGYISGIAFGTAAMALVGQYLGAGRPDLAAASGWTAFRIGGFLMCFMGAVFFLLAPLLFKLFCPHPDQQPVVEAGVPVLRLVAFAMPALACSMIFTFALRGAGDTRVPVLFTWIGFLGVRIPLAYLLTRGRLELGEWLVIPGFSLGLWGAWIAMVTDVLVRGCFFLSRFASGRWQRIQV
jgi:putative MATE family efflux protein